MHGLIAARAAVAAFDAIRYALVAIRIKFNGGIAVAHLLFQAVGGTERGEEAAGVDAALPFQSGGILAVVLHGAEVVGGFDHVLDAVAVVGQAHIAGAQPAPIRGEIKAVADFPAAAAFRFEAEVRCLRLADIGYVVIKAADLIYAGEGGHLRVAHKQAAVVGQVVADGNGRRPGMGADRFGLCPVLLLGIIAVKDAVFNLIRANLGQVSHLACPKHRTAGHPFIAFMRMIASPIIALCPIAVIAPV